MGWYERVVFNRALEAVLDQPLIHDARRRTLAGAKGEILDIGVGTGLNVPDYPPGVDRIVGLTLDRELDVRAARRASARGLQIEHAEGSAERMPFDAGRFDAVVCTFVLCSIGDQAAALREIARVLKPSGRLRFLEHVVAPSGPRRLVQRAGEPLYRAINCGCSPARDTAAGMRRAGFAFDDLLDGDLPGMLWLFRRVIQGVARVSGGR